MTWVIIGLLAITVVAALLWPLLRKPAAFASRAAYDRTIFQDQLKEVDRDVERGVLTSSEADAARLEIQRRILAAEKIPETRQSSGGFWRNASIVAVVLLVPALSGLVYLQVGSPTPQGTALTAEDEEFNKVVEQLAAKVAQNPNDLEGVMLLARTYNRTGRYAEAAALYKQALALAPDADTYASYGEALVWAERIQVTPEAHAAFVKALVLDRAEPRAQFYLGIEQAGNREEKNAIAMWRALAAATPPGAPWLQMVTEQMASVAQSAGIPPMTVEPKHALDFIPAEEVAAARLQTSAPPAAPAPPTSVAAVAPSIASQGPPGLDPALVEQIKGMVAGLAARLEANPDDYTGWLMLGRSYTVLKNTDGAKHAYEKAIALKPTEAEPRVQYLVSLMTSVNTETPGPLPQTVADAAANVLKIDPKQADALYVSGLARAKAGDAPGARSFWTQARDAMPADSPLRGDLDRRLKELN